MLLDQHRLFDALSMLGELLVLRDRQSQHFVICGGSSLLALGLVRRTTTRDVDILASLAEGKLVPAGPLPGWLAEDAEDVRAHFHLPRGWLNTGPADESFFRLGFPPKLVERVTTRIFGEKLRVSFISRYDQVFFKLYAAADQGGRHFEDLQDLKPSSEELLAAARWTRTHDPSEGFLAALREIFHHLGHDDLTDRL